MDVEDTSPTNGLTSETTAPPPTSPDTSFVVHTPEKVAKQEQPVDSDMFVLDLQGNVSPSENNQELHNAKKKSHLSPGHSESVEDGMLVNIQCKDDNGIDCPQTVSALPGGVQSAIESASHSVKEEGNNSSFAMSLLGNYDWSESSDDSGTDSESKTGSPDKTSRVLSKGNTLAVKVDTLGAYRYQAITVDSGTDDSESDSDDSSTASSSSESSSSMESSAESDIDILANNNVRERSVKLIDNEEKMKKNKKSRLLTPGELTLEDLPPIQDLLISIKEEEAQPIGTIHSIVEQQVVVAGYQNIPAIDLDSVLFLDQGKRALGHVFDLFGPVQEPFYVVRFNSAKHIKDNRIEVGDKVYFAPTTEHTSFVVIDELMQIKGSDASGMKDNEVLAGEDDDFSDDEKESRSKGNGESKYHNSNEFQPQRKRGRVQHGKPSTQRNPFAVRGGMARFNQSTVRPSRFQPPSIQQHPPWGSDSMRPDIRGSPSMPHNRFQSYQNQYANGGPHRLQFSAPPPGYQFGNPPNPSNTAGFPMQPGPSMHPPAVGTEMNGWPSEAPAPFQFNAPPPPSSIQNGLPPPSPQQNIPSHFPPAHSVPPPPPTASSVPRHTFQSQPPPFMPQFGTPPPFPGPFGPPPSPFSQSSVPQHNELPYPYHTMPPPQQ